MIDRKIRQSEQMPALLGELYSKCGYALYRTCGFEEYDSYTPYRDFLGSQQIITFTGVGGRLLALKPDITMSIIKDATDEEGIIDKYYYSENVYRVPAGGDEYKEILQIGLECIGDVSDYDRAEVLTLAARTLAATGRDYIIDISSMSLVGAILDSLSLSGKARDEAVEALKSKNSAALVRLCDSLGKSSDVLLSMSKMSMEIDKAVDALREICFGIDAADSSIRLIEKIACAVGEDERAHIRFDFSVIHDMNYYDGIVLSGYVDGVSEAILKGGEYGRLISKMGRDGSALGFALYADLLERLDDGVKNYVGDILLVIGDASPALVAEAVAKLSSSDERVLVQKSAKGRDRCKRTVILCEDGSLREV